MPIKEKRPAGGNQQGRSAKKNTLLSEYNENLVAAQVYTAAVLSCFSTGALVTELNRRVPDRIEVFELLGVEYGR
jgi:hypothetical protein